MPAAPPPKITLTSQTAHFHQGGLNVWDSEKIRTFFAVGDRVHFNWHNYPKGWLTGTITAIYDNTMLINSNNSVYHFHPTDDAIMLALEQDVL